MGCGIGVDLILGEGRSYRMARRSAVECASHGLVCRQLKLVDEALLDQRLTLLHRIVAMLMSMVKKRTE